LPGFYLLKEDDMNIQREAKLLRIFVGESDKHHLIPVYEKIVLSAREQGLAGATVFKGIMSFGGSSRIHTNKILRLSEDLPLIIEIVDEIEKIEKFLPFVDQLFTDANCGGLITIEKAAVIKYTTGKN
jgi:PII-like signaling protein